MIETCLTWRVATPLNRFAVELAYRRKATGRKLDLRPSINFLFQNAFAKQLQRTRKEQATLRQLRTSSFAVAGREHSFDCSDYWY